MNFKRIEKAEDRAYELRVAITGLATQEVLSELHDAHKILTEVRRFAAAWAEADEVGEHRQQAGQAESVREGANQARKAAIEQLIAFITF